MNIIMVSSVNAFSTKIQNKYLDVVQLQSWTMV